MSAYLTSDEKWRFELPAELPAFLTQGLVCLEDKHYYRHLGVDPFAIVRALKQNYSLGRRVSGASTLSMQVARLLKPSERTMRTKMAESLRALQLETQLSKKEILRLYLSYAPYGSNIEGIESASYRYFGKSSGSLGVGEAAFLFTLPQAPSRWEQKDEARLVAARNRVLQRWRDCQVVDQVTYEAALKLDIPKFQSEYPRFASHFANWIVSQQKSPATLRTSLDSGLQASLESLMAGRRQQLEAKGIHNGAALVASNDGSMLLAAVGNFAGLDTNDGQQLASFLAYRSPGSTLKPFLFARLLEIGQITSESLLEDVPFNIAEYDPKNYDGTFSGLVEAKWALAHSLNVPFVKELHRLGVGSFLEFLKQGGFRSAQPDEDLGLSLIIGGVSVRMWELMPMYLALANGGVYRPLKWQEHVKGNDKKWDWINPGAVELTAEALTLRGRPDYALDSTWIARNNQVHWKTGTSQGRRDAWAFGFDTQVTIGVWLGNLDNASSPSLAGADVAAPLLFDAFSLLKDDKWKTRPDTYLGSPLKMIEVCALSGLAATEACPTKKLVKGISGQVIQRSCPYHQFHLVDAVSHLRVNQSCLSEKMKPMIKSFVVTSDAVRYWSSSEWNSLDTLPRYHDSCKVVQSEKGKMKILSPESRDYQALDTKLILPLQIQGGDLEKDLSCFLNGVPLLKHPNLLSGLNHQHMLSLKRGDFDLICADKLGHSAQARFSVNK